jgi:hypothetical protein
LDVDVVLRSDSKPLNTILQAQYKLCFTALLACQKEYRTRVEGKPVTHAAVAQERRASSASTDSLVTQLKLASMRAADSSRRPSMDVAGVRGSDSRYMFVE